MTTPNDDKIDPLDAAIANINSKLEEKFKTHDEKLENFSSNVIREVREIIKPEPEKKSWLDEDDDDNAYVTKADLKNTLREVVSETKAVTKNIVAEQNNKANLDVQSLRDHPEINTPDMLKEVHRDMIDRVNRGRSPEDPFLFADSVAAVYSKAVRQGRIIPSHLAKRRHEKDNAEEDNFDMGGSPTPKTETISARSIAIARRMGLSEQRFRELREIKRKS